VSVYGKVCRAGDLGPGAPHRCGGRRPSRRAHECCATLRDQEQLDGAEHRRPLGPHPHAAEALRRRGHGGGRRRRLEDHWPRRPGGAADGSDVGCAGPGGHCRGRPAGSPSCRQRGAPAATLRVARHHVAPRVAWSGSNPGCKAYIGGRGGCSQADLDSGLCQTDDTAIQTVSAIWRHEWEPSRRRPTTSTRT
jgi:hypothetical protein